MTQASQGLGPLVGQPHPPSQTNIAAHVQTSSVSSDPEAWKVPSGFDGCDFYFLNLKPDFSEGHNIFFYKLVGREPENG